MTPQAAVSAANRTDALSRSQAAMRFALGLTASYVSVVYAAKLAPHADADGPRSRLASLAQKEAGHYGGKAGLRRPAGGDQPGSSWAMISDRSVSLKGLVI